MIDDTKLACMIAKNTHSMLIEQQIVGWFCFSRSAFLYLAMQFAIFLKM